MFASFEAEPLGTASLAQVHRATLHTGEVEMELLLSWCLLSTDDDVQVVAVKVQHKYVKKHSFVDIWSCDLLVRTVKVIFPQFRYKQSHFFC